MTVSTTMRRVFVLAVLMVLLLQNVAQAFSQTALPYRSPQSLGMLDDEDEPAHSLVTPRPSSSKRMPNSSRRNGARNQSLQKGNHPLQSLNMNLDSLAKSNQIGAAARAQELLQRIEALHQEGYYAVAPDIVSLNSVLNAWANSCDQGAAEKALQLLDEELEKLDPNVISFNTVILAFAKRGAVKEAETLMHKMEHIHHVMPDTISYNSLIYAYAQANQPEQAERVLREMMQLSTVKPDTITFNTVLLAWSKSAARKGACQRAEELLKHMEVLHQAGNDLVAPDVYSYSTVLQALAMSRSVTASSRALKILEAMEQSSNISPNTVTYTTVMTALSKSGYKNAAQESQKLLDRMIAFYNAGNDECKPDTVAYTAVISCWARGYEHEHADEQALRLFEKMKEDPETQPNALTYTSVLKALARSQKASAVQMAEELLHEMETAYQNGNPALQPTSIHYNVVMDVHAKSPSYDKAIKAHRLYKQMGQRPFTQPNIVTYNTLLRACANTFGTPETKKEALEICIHAFSAIIKSDDIKPSSITFVFFMKAVRKLVPSDRKELLQKSFQYCCKLGLLNDIILQQVKLACQSDTELAALLQVEGASRDVSAFDLPVEWTRFAEQVHIDRSK